MDSEFTLDFPVWQSALWCGLTTSLTLIISFLIYANCQALHSYPNLLGLIGLNSILIIIFSIVGCINWKLYNTIPNWKQKLGGIKNVSKTPHKR